MKNLPENLLKELKKLKVELGCKTWAELLAKLVESEKTISLSEKELEDMRTGVQGFLKLGNVVSTEWASHSTVLEESRRTRHHDTR